MKVVLDTNVLVTALRSRRGLSRLFLEAALRGRFEMLATPALFFEYEEVLKRPEHLAAMGLTVPLVEEFLNGLATLITPVEVSFLWRPQLTDAADEMVLEAAVNGRADWIITYNVRHFRVAAVRFGIRVSHPKAALPFFPEVNRAEE